MPVGAQTVPTVPAGPADEETVMAKEQKRGSRETRKPKQKKPAAAAPVPMKGLMASGTTPKKKD
jgi:hypothetical protein